MAGLYATAGSKIYIGPAKAFQSTDFVESDFTSGSPVYVECKGLTDMGGAGDTSVLISSNQIDIQRTRKAKGSRNAGSQQLLFDLDLSDAGQLALVAAEKTSLSYSFKFQLNDAPVGGTPSIRYHTAFVMSAAEQYSEADSAMKLSVMLEIDSNIVRVAAAA